LPVADPITGGAQRFADGAGLARIGQLVETTQIDVIGAEQQMLPTPGIDLLLLALRRIDGVRLSSPAGG